MIIDFFYSHPILTTALTCVLWLGIFYYLVFKLYVEAHVGRGWRNFARKHHGAIKRHWFRFPELRFCLDEWDLTVRLLFETRDKMPRVELVCPVKEDIGLFVGRKVSFFPRFKSINTTESEVLVREFNKHFIQSASNDRILRKLIDLEIKGLLMSKESVFPCIKIDENHLKITLADYPVTEEGIEFLFQLASAVLVRLREI